MRTNSLTWTYWRGVQERERDRWVRRWSSAGGVLAKAGSRLTTVGVVGLFAVVTALGFASGHRHPEVVAVLYLVPVTIVGWNLGWRWALSATVVGIGLAATWGSRGAVTMTPDGYLALALVLAVPGLLAARAAGGLRDTRDQSWFDKSNDLLVEANLQGYFIRMTERWEDTLGWSRQELMARPFRELVHPDDLAATEVHAGALERGPGQVLNFENRYLAKDGSWRWLLWSARSDGRRKYAVAHDITPWKQLEQQRRDQLREVGILARTDALTGLPNRRAWDEALVTAVGRASVGGEQLVLAMVDLDEFKRFNDRYGHTAGDSLLRHAAHQWGDVLRGTDVLARYGGEEFAVLLSGCHMEAAVLLLERLRAATPGPETCSVGVAAWMAGESAEELVVRADAALYRAKRQGRDRLVVAGAQGQEPGPDGVVAVRSGPGATPGSGGDVDRGDGAAAADLAEAEAAGSLEAGDPRVQRHRGHLGGGLEADCANVRIG